MFIYFLSKLCSLPTWFLRLVYKPLVWYYVSQLQAELTKRIGAPLELNISYNCFRPDVLLTAQEYTGSGWRPRFRFAVRADHAGVLLYSLKLPVELQHQGIGRYCINWLKEFCQCLNLSYIVLGAYPEAEGFWLKMGFTRLSPADWDKYWSA